MKKKSHLKYKDHFHEQSQGHRHKAAEPAGRVMAVAALCRALFANRPAMPVTGALPLAVRSFSETVIHVKLIAQYIIRQIYPCPCDLSPAFLCLVSSENK